MIIKKDWYWHQRLLFNKKSSIKIFFWHLPCLRERNLAQEFFFNSNWFLFFNLFLGYLKPGFFSFFWCFSSDGWFIGYRRRVIYLQKIKLNEWHAILLNKEKDGGQVCLPRLFLRPRHARLSHQGSHVWYFIFKKNFIILYVGFLWIFFLNSFINIWLFFKGFLWLVLVRFLWFNIFLE